MKESNGTCVGTIKITQNKMMANMATMDHTNGYISAIMDPIAMCNTSFYTLCDNDVAGYVALVNSTPAES